MSRTPAPPCTALAEALAERLLLGESEVVSANVRGPLTAAFLLDGIAGLARSPRRSLLRLCVAVWQVDDPGADARITACLAELEGCVCCALGALHDEGAADAHKNRPRPTCGSR